MKEINMRLKAILTFGCIVIFSDSSQPLLFSDALPYDPTNKESVENYIPERILTMRIVGSVDCDFKFVEIFDDRCVYINFMGYRKCFELSEENYQKLLIFLKSKKQQNIKLQNACCKYVGFIEYKSEDIVFRSCSWLLQNAVDQKFKDANNLCLNKDELAFEKDVIALIDEMIRSDGFYIIKYDIQTLVLDTLKISKRYGSRMNECTGCLPSKFHSPEFNERNP